VRRRLDAEMVRRGLATNRAEASQAIRSGKVMVSGRLAAKAGTLVLPEEPIVLAAPARKFVSRAGEKLEAALTGFGIDVAGRGALDAGASTGGFTDCLLSRGAAHVVAVDVGYGQLDFRLREDPRVTILERTNVRDLGPGDLPYLPEVLTSDLSFISLRIALPALVRCSGPEATFVLLVKPQFEAGRGQTPGGVVRDPAVWRSTLDSVATAAAEQGLGVLGLMASPLRGPAGNVEFLMYAVRTSGGSSVPTLEPAGDRGERVDAAIRQAEALALPSHG
jgi:23S rRNA (cytidine1920-2'-O)/16S rRNA (cytidine1409-2'-O)-methyltransferase